MDDAALLRLIGSWKPPTEWLRLARGTVLWRQKNVISLWKLRDEYRTLSTRAAPISADKRIDPTILLATLYEDVPALEDALNQEAPRLDPDIRFLVAKTALKPFEVENGNGGGSYIVLAQSDGRPIQITDESAMVRSLQEVVGREPPFGVTVVGPPDFLRAKKPELEELFVNVAKNLLEHWPPSEQTSGLVGSVATRARAASPAVTYTGRDRGG